MDYRILETRICSGATNDHFVWRWSEVRQIMFYLKNENIVQQEGHFYIIGTLVCINITLVCDYNHA